MGKAGMRLKAARRRLMYRGILEDCDSPDWEPITAELPEEIEDYADKDAS